jgi:hypothetical protein
MGEAYKELDTVMPRKGCFRVFEVISKKEADVGGSEDTHIFLKRDAGEGITHYKRVDLEGFNIKYEILKGENHE